MLSRRTLLQLASAGLLLPALPAWTASKAGERKFMFIFCSGGWDPTYCFAPMFHSSVVDMEDTATTGTAGGITFVDDASRPSVQAFFEDHHQRTCIINGIESRSVAHDICLRLIMTGSTLATTNDWPSTLASRSAQDRLLPMVNISGPSYTSTLASSVVRVGSNGQLSGLLSGDIFAQEGSAISLPSDEVQALEDAFVLARAEQAAAAAARGRAQAILDIAATSEEHLEQLLELSDDLNLSGGTNLVERASILSECFEKGLSRCGMVEYNGFMDLSWDTHGANVNQGFSFEELTSSLSQIIADLESRPGEVSTSLLDEVTIVVLSEMGRYPQLNDRGGKEHWTFTSAMLIGAGVAGDQVIGGYSAENYSGESVDLVSGEITSSGTDLLPGHLGATLMAMADIDPGDFLSESPIEAAIASS